MYFICYPVSTKVQYFFWFELFGSFLIFVNLFFIGLSYLLQGIGILWLSVVILGLATLMSFVLVNFAKARTKETIDSEYFVVKIWERRKKKKRINEKSLIRNIPLEYPNKVNTGLN